MRRAHISSARLPWQRRGFGLWAVEIPDVAPFIGFVGLHEATFAVPFTPAVEVGWRLARAHWGNGYATEAALASLRWGFETARLTEILSFTATRNTRSIPSDVLSKAVCVTS